MVHETTGLVTCSQTARYALSHHCTGMFINSARGTACSLLHSVQHHLHAIRIAHMLLLWKTVVNTAYVGMHIHNSRYDILNDWLHLLQGSVGSGCKADLKAKQKRYSQLAAKYAAQFGKSLGLSTQDLLWGLAMVGIVTTASPIPCIKQIAI